MKTLFKYGLALIQNNKLLLCKPYAFDDLILPGGLKEEEETFEEGLQREAYEELGESAIIKKGSLEFLGKFEDIAAGRSDTTVEIELYLGDIEGELVPSSEIKELVWFPVDGDKKALSPIIRNKILPFLVSRGYLDIGKIS